MDTMKKEYAVLFNAISDTIRRLGEMQLQLMLYQQIAEELYINDQTKEAEALPSRPSPTLLT